MNRSFDDVLRSACHHGGSTRAEVLGPARTRKHARNRHLLMFLARKWTGDSLAAIGARVGGRDHSTVLWGIRKIERLLGAGDPDVGMLVELVELDLAQNVHRGKLTDLEVVDMDPHGEQGDAPPYVTATYTRADGTRWLFRAALTRLR